MMPFSWYYVIVPDLLNQLFAYSMNFIIKFRINLIFCRNLRIGYFSQHHVDSLSMNQTSLGLFKERFPGLFIILLYQYLRLLRNHSTWEFQKLPNCSKIVEVFAFWSIIQLTPCNSLSIGIVENTGPSCFFSTRHTSWHLLVQSQEWKHQSNVWNRSQVNNKDTRTTSLTSWLCL